MTKKFIGYSSRNNFEDALTDAIHKAKIDLTTDFIDWKLDYIKGQDGGFVLARDLYVGIDADAHDKVKANEAAYFQVEDASDSLKPFLIKIVDPAKIEHARKILSGDEKCKIHLSGLIVKETISYNTDWSFHIDPTSIDFFQVAIELCDATMEFIEANLNDIGGSTLPNNHWCPWSSKLIAELSYDDLKEHCNK